MAKHPRTRLHLAVGAALLVLATATFLLSFVLTGTLDYVSALAFAVAKASLVVWFFMDLSEEGTTARASFAVSLAFFALLFGLAVTDAVLLERFETPPSHSPGGP